MIPVPLILVVSSTFSFLLFSVLLLGLAGVVIYQKRKKRRRNENQFHSVHIGEQGGIGLQTMTENDLYESAQLLSADTLNLIGCKAILEQERVVIERQIGAGNFGKVYKGTSYSSYSSKTLSPSQDIQVV